MLHRRSSSYWAHIGAVAGFLAACCAGQPGEFPQAGKPGLPSPTCADACARWRALGCREAGPTPGGASCEAACEAVQGSGLVRYDLRCLSGVETCDQILLCGPG
jgi:hypothetical protein